MARCGHFSKLLLAMRQKRAIRETVHLLSPLPLLPGVRDRRVC
jgi:hypothetical protein